MHSRVPGIKIKPKHALMSSPGQSDISLSCTVRVKFWVEMKISCQTKRKGSAFTANVAPWHFLAYSRRRSHQKADPPAVVAHYCCRSAAVCTEAPWLSKSGWAAIKTWCDSAGKTRQYEIKQEEVQKNQKNIEPVNCSCGGFPALGSQIHEKQRDQKCFNQREVAKMMICVH